MSETKHYTPDDIIRMQKDATQRVQAMRNKERETVKNFNRSFNRNLSNKREVCRKKEELIEPPESCDEQTSNLHIKNLQEEKQQDKVVCHRRNNFTDLILKDPEKTLLLVLILLLLNENENPIIILVLIHILL